MRIYIIVIVILFFSLNAFSQKDRLYKMKKEETASFFIDKTYTSDSFINISNQSTLSSLSISGKVKLFDKESLIRIILITKTHEHLVYEVYPLINDSLDFSIDKVCEETSLMNNEMPIELILIIRKAELYLKQIHVSNLDLNENETNSFVNLNGGSKKQIEKYKASQINFDNEKKYKTWLAAATELAILPFEEKKNYFGGGYDFITDGYEYYIDGIFSFSSFQPTDLNLNPTTTTTYPSEFDWRNRHGQNWMTPISLQGTTCGACAAFTTVAVAEIMTNLYFNSHIDLDLSEQELVSCAGVSCQTGYNNYLRNLLNYIKDNSINTETCFPYTATNSDCSNVCLIPTEKIGIFSVFGVGYSESEIKKALIFKGPLLSTIRKAGWSHAMAMVGYHTIQQGDIIKRIDNETNNWIEYQVPAKDPFIGKTYYVFKNSYQNSNGGYVYVFFNNVVTDLSIDGGIITPITSLNYSEKDRVCVDKDGDGYYNWGIGSKPITCPACSTNQEDGDDSNPNLGPLDAYGNCTPISSPYIYMPHLITSIETWQTIYSECGDVVVKNGGNLTINGATVNLEGNAIFSVEVNSTLTFMSGIIQ